MILLGFFCVFFSFTLRRIHFICICVILCFQLQRHIGGTSPTSAVHVEPAADPDEARARIHQTWFLLEPLLRLESCLLIGSCVFTSQSEDAFRVWVTFRVMFGEYGPRTSRSHALSSIDWANGTVGYHFIITIDYDDIHVAFAINKYFYHWIELIFSQSLNNCDNTRKLRVDNVGYHRQTTTFWCWYSILIDVLDCLLSLLDVFHSFQEAKFGQFYKLWTEVVPSLAT